MTGNNWPVGNGLKSRATALSSDDDSTIESYTPNISTRSDTGDTTIDSSFLGSIESYPPNISTRSDTGDTTIDSCFLVARSFNLNMSCHPTLGLFDLNKRATVSVSDHLDRYADTVATDITNSDKSLAPPSVAGDSLFDGSISVLENPRRCFFIGQIVSKLKCYRNNNDKKKASYVPLGRLRLLDEQEQSGRVLKKKTNKKNKAQEDDEPSVTTDSSHDANSNVFSPLLRVEPYQSNTSNRNINHRRVRYQHTRSLSAPHLNVGMLNNLVSSKNSGRRKSTLITF